MKNDKKNTQSELSSTGSYFTIQKYCLQRGVKAYSYDEFEDRLPRPKKKNEPRGAKIIVRKSSLLKKKPSEEGSVHVGQKDNSNNISNSMALPSQEKLSEVTQLENQLLKLIDSITRVTGKKIGKENYQDVLEQIYHKVGELIKQEPLNVKAPLSSELQKAYGKLLAMV